MALTRTGELPNGHFVRAAVASRPRRPRCAAVLRGSRRFAARLSSSPARLVSCLFRLSESGGQSVHRVARISHFPPAIGITFRRTTGRELTAPSAWHSCRLNRLAGLRIQPGGLVFRLRVSKSEGWCIRPTFGSSHLPRPKGTILRSIDSIDPVRSLPVRASGFRGRAHLPLVELDVAA